MDVIRKRCAFIRTKCTIYFKLIGSQKGRKTTVFLVAEQINDVPSRLQDPSDVN